ncbi:MAG: rRNA maturation RNase YbeY [Bacteroidales bacterium]|nr:rRNA maturation RNase YbeY [Bacteroidales bacterium]
MAITFSYDENIKFRLKKSRDVKSWIFLVAHNYKYNIESVNYLFCDDTYILEANKKFLNHDYYTDIITFDYTEMHDIFADILISVDTVKSNSKKFGTKFSDEILRVIIHGILHMVGFDDKVDEEREKMRAEENRWLKVFYDEF